MTKRVDEWVAAGEMRNVSPEAVAVLLVGIVVSCCNLHDLFELTPLSKMSPEDVAARCAEICVAGLMPA